MANFRGTYSGGTTYSPGDSVTYSGTYWYCITTSTGEAPSSSAKWITQDTFTRPAGGAASGSAEGIVELAGDLGGTAASPQVVGTHLASALPANQGGTGSTARNFAGLLTPTAVKTTTYTAAAGDFVPCDTTSGGFTVTLPAAPANLSVVGIKQVIQGGTNTVSVACGGSDVFNKASGATSGTLTLLAQGMLLQYKATGAIWYVVADDLPLSQLDSRYVAQSSLPLVIGSGGTGQITQQAAIDALTGTQSNNKVLRSDGTHATLASLQAGDVPTLNQNTSGTAAGLSSTLAIGSGGTGQASKSAAFNALSPNAALGDLTYGSGTNTSTNLAGNTTSTKKFFTQTGNGTISAAPGWNTIASGDLPSLDQLTAPAANVSLNSHKITSLTNGTAAQDAVAFGQLPANWGPADHGLLAWSYDVAITNGSATALATAGTLYVTALKLPIAATVTNIILNLVTSGGTLTSGQCFAGLWQGAGGALLGVTADQSTNWAAAAALQTMPISGGPVSVAAGIVYVGAWFRGTTGPAFWRSASNVFVNVGLSAAASRWGTANTGLTTTAPSPLGTITAANTTYWAALS